MYQDSVSAEAGSEPAEAVDASTVATAVSADLPTVDTADVADAAETADANSAHLFRDELARAMHAASERERVRIEAAVDEDAIAHVDKVRSRATAESAELKRLAEEDVTGIRSWAKSEIERIRTEADTQINDRRERLEQHLVAHASIIDGEVDRVSEAVDGYRNELDVYFVRLAIERDPSEIARLADAVPEPPDLEVIRAVARAEAVDRLSKLEASAEAPGTDAPVAVDPAVEATADSSSDPEAEAELVAVPMASAESAGDAEGSGTDLVAVMTDFVAVMIPLTRRARKPRRRSPRPTRPRTTDPTTTRARRPPVPVARRTATPRRPRPPTWPRPPAIRRPTRKPPYPKRSVPVPVLPTTPRPGSSAASPAGDRTNTGTAVRRSDPGRERSRPAIAARLIAGPDEPPA